MKIFINLLVSGLAVFATAYLLPGVEVESFIAAVMVALVLGILNTFVKPIILLLTLPINFITLGLFTFVINVALVLLASSLVSGFMVTGFLSGLLFSVVLSIVNSFLGMID